MLYFIRHNNHDNAKKSIKILNDNYNTIDIPQGSMEKSANQAGQAATDLWDVVAFIQLRLLLVADITNESLGFILLDPDTSLKSFSILCSWQPIS